VCFSAEASFAVGIALIPAGVYCLWAAALKKPSFLGLAALPIFFGIQQISEGFVWQGRISESSDEINSRAASLVFLFFALAFWPFWFPLLAAIMEPQRRRRLIFVVLTVLATFWFWALYYPLLTDQISWSARVEHHSIQYEYDALPVYRFDPSKMVLRLLYFLSVALPPALCSVSWGRIPGIVLGASALAAMLLYSHAFVSVWCFFAAMLSIYCVFLFYRLPTPAKPGNAVPVAS
jgi:hypothetical protein